MSKQRKPWKSGRGFTLIELLVVVAIIALLVSILLPSLSRAKDITRRTICAVNSRNVYTSLMVYSESNNTWFPPLGSVINAQGTVGWDYNIRAPIFTTYSYYTNGYGSAAYPPGALVEQKYVTNPEIYYCPCQQNKSFSWQSQKKNWGQGKGGSISYDWNPHVLVPGQYGGVLSYRKTPIPQNKAFLVDTMDRVGYLAHSTDGVPGWNVCMGGGAVVYRTSQKVYNMALALETGGNYIGADWITYTTALDLLENP